MSDTDQLAILTARCAAHGVILNILGGALGAAYPAAIATIEKALNVSLDGVAGSLDAAGVKTMRDVFDHFIASLQPGADGENAAL